MGKKKPDDAKARRLTIKMLKEGRKQKDIAKVVKRSESWVSNVKKIYKKTQVAYVKGRQDESDAASGVAMYWEMQAKKSVWWRPKKSDPPRMQQESNN